MPRGTTRGLAGSSTRVVAPRLVGSPPPSARCCLRLACAPCWSVVMLQVAAEAQNCGGGLLEREAHDNLETPRLWTRQICSAFAAPAHLRGLGRRNDNQTKPLGRDRRPAGNSTRPRPPPPAANTAPCMHSCSPRCSPAPCPHDPSLCYKSITAPETTITRRRQRERHRGAPRPPRPPPARAACTQLGLHTV